MPTVIELRELDDDELEGRLAEYRRELLNLRFKLATGQLDNVSRLSQARKDVARVLTILRDREIALAEGREGGPVVAARPRPAPRRVRDEEAAEQPEGADSSLDIDEGEDEAEPEVASAQAPRGRASEEDR